MVGPWRAHFVCVRPLSISAPIARAGILEPMGVAKGKGAGNEPAGGYRKMYVPGSGGAMAASSSAADDHHAHLHQQHSAGGGAPAGRAQQQAGGKGRKQQQQAPQQQRARPTGGFTQLGGDDGFWPWEDEYADGGGGSSGGRRSRGDSGAGGRATAASLDRAGVALTWVCPICTFAENDMLDTACTVCESARPRSPEVREA